ncbi:uncharacterized protein ACA1_062440 [Acanthamoeba castellanii str. Neff]|uniref:Uncharacterized protein n=1 Tax=Acanthamoeba castellanii (strain ATCC 30010 / Neff) TaxID=1257118 RepID=L8GZG5_ACACF|nr:uncharacterized protein ACA1_062440 [Acanthamoeba castellanii str. Neff]ELR17501.1 hypothetical protein ACA1_062440 [Acanthamoeba castellanii str. Neff]
MDERVIQSLMAVMRGGAVGSGGASSEPGRQPQQPQQQQLAPPTQQQAYLQQQLALQQFAALLTAYPSLFANLDPQTALQWQLAAGLLPLDQLQQLQQLAPPTPQQSHEQSSGGDSGFGRQAQQPSLMDIDLSRPTTQHYSGATGKRTNEQQQHYGHQPPQSHQPHQQSILPRLEPYTNSAASASSSSYSPHRSAASSSSSPSSKATLNPSQTPSSTSSSSASSLQTIGSPYASPPVAFASPPFPIPNPEQFLLQHFHVQLCPPK